jgi:5'-nucleotidase
VIGGHTHTFLAEPRVVKDARGNAVTIVQAGWAGLLLGRLDVSFSKRTKRKRTTFLTEKVSK